MERIKMKKVFKNWTKVDLIWLIIANVSILICNLYWQSDLFSIIITTKQVIISLELRLGLIKNAFSILIFVTTLE